MKMRQVWLLPAVATCALALGAAPAAYAQKITGDVTGSVTDSSGGAIGGADVSALCPDTGLSRRATTTTTGVYRLPELPVCVYKVSATAQGFKTTNREVQVAVGSVTTADFRLQVGVRSDEVTVEAAAPLVEMSGKLNNYVDKARIDDLPLSGRDFNSLLGITPGVYRAPGGGFLAVNVSGARRTANNYMIDGLPNNDRYYGDSLLNQTGVVGVPATLVPMDAIAEFTVQQTPSAEFGVKGGAAINVVMRSGTNELHGSGHYFRHDDFTDAANFFNKANGPAGCKGQACGKRTPLTNQQFGGTIGGPLVKDKTFFFGYYEGQRLSTESPYQANVPTPTQVATARARIATAGLKVNPIGEALLKYYPIDPRGTITISTPALANSDSGSFKLDHRLNDSNQLALRYFFGISFQSAPAFTGTLTPPPDAGPPDMFNSVLDPKTKAQLLGFTWTSTLSPSQILETRVGWTQFDNTIAVNNHVDPKSLGLDTGPLDPKDFGVPAIYTLGSFGYIGGVGGYPITTSPTRTLDVSSSYTWITGRHTLKFGGNVQHASTKSLRNRARTSIDITGGGDDVDALVGLLLGRFDDATRAFGTTNRLIKQNSLGLFVSDDFRLTPRFTLNLGLRYDISGALGEKDNLGSNFFPDRGLVDLGKGIDRLYDIDKNNFGPRFGFSWDVAGNGRTALRGGYSLTYDIPNFGSIHAPRTSFAGSRTGAFTQINQGIFSVFLGGDTSVPPDDPAATCLNPDTGAGGDYICATPGVPLYGRSPSGSPPFSAFSVVKNLQTPMYHFFHLSLQHELFHNNVVTVSYVGSRGRDGLMYRNINARPIGGGPRPFASRFPNLAAIIQLTNDSKSWYDSAQISFRQSNWKGINTQYNFTLSRCRDYVSINRGSRTNFPQKNNPYDPADNKGPCAYEVPRNFNAGGTYKIPKIGSSRMGDGWEFATVFTALDGTPFSPNLGSRDPSGQGVNAIRANCNAAIKYNTRDPQHYVANPKDAFSIPPSGTVGTCGRNVGRLPGLSQWDLSLVKMTRITERTKLQFRWEVFNVLNRANFGALLTTNIRSGNFGTIGSTPDVDAGNPVISQGGPRSMQWALKLLF